MVHSAQYKDGIMGILTDLLNSVQYRDREKDNMQEYICIGGETYISHRHANIMQTGNRDKTDVERGRVNSQSCFSPQTSRQPVRK